MKTKFNGILTLLLAFTVHFAFAQKTVTGTVSDDTGALPGVNVVIQGTNTGTETDFDGNYSIQANVGDVLQFSYVGMDDKSVTVGTDNVYNVTMTAGVMLDAVVVTAFGVKKEKKSLGYAVTTVKADEVNQKAESDVARALQGKAAGVNITSSNGMSGSATNITVRGNSSITGSNQPLFVVDGVPFSSDTNSQSSFWDNKSESSRFLDLDPNIIESVSVLKGLSATTLYGEQGRNGVILITTKSGNTKAGNGTTKVTVASSIFASKPHLPDYQDDYGNGFNQNFAWYFSNWGAAFDDTDPSHFGSYYSSTQNGTVYITHPFATNSKPDFIVGYEDLAASEYEYRPYDSVSNFFRTGLSSDISVSIQGGNENLGYSLNYGKLNDLGFTPGNELGRTTFGLGGFAKKGKFTARASFNIADTDYKSPPVAAAYGSGVLGGGSSIFSDLMYTPRSVDLMGIPYQRADGGSLYYRESNSIQNPRWTAENSKTGQGVKRYFGQINLNYDITENISAQYKYGLDTYTEDSFYGQNKGGIDGKAEGMFYTTNAINTIKDHTLMFNFRNELTEDLGLAVTLGGNTNGIDYKQDGIESTEQVVYGILEHYNFVSASSESFIAGKLAYKKRQNKLGVFGEATLSYKDYLYFNLAGRNDWSSVLEANNNHIFYPSTSISFIPTSAVESLQDSKILSYLKLRAGYGTSAGFPSVYNTRNSVDLQSQGFIAANGDVITYNSNSSQLGNPNLKPELVSELEFGIDSRFINNRIGFNASVYSKQTTDLLTLAKTGPSIGANYTYINGGNVTNKGIELDLDAKIFQNTDGINWDIYVNFSKDKSEVTELPEGKDMIAIGSYISQYPKNTAIVGQPYGVFTGSTVATNDAGDLLVDSSGNYVETETTDNIIGDPNPDFLSNFGTSVSYKGLTLSASMGFRKGGDIFSYTVSTLVNRGLVDFPLDRYGSYVLPGVSQETGEPNTMMINATEVAFNNWFSINSFKVYDGTTIRLNEVNLSYALPKKLLNKLPVNGVSVAVSGSNLWYRALNIPKAVNFDTNTLSTGVGNNMGIDMFTGPSAAKVGASIKIKL